MLLTVPSPTRYTTRGRWHFVYLTLVGGEVMRVTREVVRRRGRVVTLDDAARRATLEVAHAATAGRLATPFDASAAAYGLSMRLLAWASHAADAADRPDAVARALDLVRRRFADAIGVEDMAAAAGLSRYHFSRIFRQSEGIGPGGYLLRRRLREAARLLGETDLPLAEVAARCGFADAGYFGRAFRRAYSAPPGAFRASGMYGRGG